MLARTIRKRLSSFLTALIFCIVPTHLLAATIQLLSHQTTTVGNAVATVSGTGAISISLAGDDLFSSATVIADLYISDVDGFTVGMGGNVQTSCSGRLEDCATFDGATLALLRLNPDPALLFDVTPSERDVFGDTFASHHEPYNSGTYRIVAQLSQLGGGTPFTLVGGGIQVFPIPEPSSEILFPVGLATAFMAFVLSRPRFLD